MIVFSYYIFFNLVESILSPVNFLAILISAERRAVYLGNGADIF